MSELLRQNLDVLFHCCGNGLTSEEEDQLTEEVRRLLDEHDQNTWQKNESSS